MLTMVRYFLANGAKKFITKYSKQALEKVKAYIKKICSLPCPKIFHNAQYDVGWLEASGITVNGPIIDLSLIHI